MSEGVREGMREEASEQASEQVCVVVVGVPMSVRPCEYVHVHVYIGCCGSDGAHMTHVVHDSISFPLLFRAKVALEL